MSMCPDGLVLEKAGTILSSAPILRLNEPRSLRIAEIAALVFLQMSSRDVSWAIDDCYLGTHMPEAQVRRKRYAELYVWELERITARINAPQLS